MPYFVYKISPPHQLEHLETIERYQDARTLVRSRRQIEDRSTGIKYRLIFARQQSEAEQLLTHPHEDQIIEEE